MSRHVFRERKDTHLARDCRLDHLLERVLCMGAELARMAMMRERHSRRIGSDGGDKDVAAVAMFSVTLQMMRTVYLFQV